MLILRPSVPAWGEEMGTADTPGTSCGADRASGATGKSALRSRDFEIGEPYVTKIGPGSPIDATSSVTFPRSTLPAVTFAGTPSHLNPSTLKTISKELAATTKAKAPF